MTYSEAIQFLYGLQIFGAKLGLENTFKLAALAGNPQEKLRFIHVAGTNGKGSTCAMLESIYRAAGLRVGLFTSPHLVSFRERIQINRQLVSEADVARLVEGAQLLLKNFPAEAHPTFFEVVTVMALKYFAEQNCELVIWETGLGGRLDATNIVMPLASAITNVQLDHQKWLGETLAEIAREKAGIIKENIPTVTGAEDPDALRIISQIAAEKKSPLTVVTPADARGLNDLELSLPGEHQKRNSAVALGVVKALQKQIPVSEEIIRRGLRTVTWQGRLQMIERGHQKILLDGAHNPAGAQTLADALQDLLERGCVGVADQPQRVGKFGNAATDAPTPHTVALRTQAQPALIFGVMRDKDFTAIIKILSPLASKIFLSPMDSERSADPTELIDLFRAENAAAKISACQNLAEAFEKSAGEKFVVVTGSLHFIGEAIELLGVSSEPSERALNEWTATPKSK